MSEITKDLRHVPAGQWKVVRVDGTIEVILGKPTIREVLAAIKATGLDTVALRANGVPTGAVMLVDDTGLTDGKPANPVASQLYWEQCIPGTTHPICGDVAICDDSDFADE
jgi:hypothetical protein